MELNKYTNHLVSAAVKNSRCLAWESWMNLDYHPVKSLVDWSFWMTEETLRNRCFQMVQNQWILHQLAPAARKWLVSWAMTVVVLHLKMILLHILASSPYWCEVPECLEADWCCPQSLQHFLSKTLQLTVAGLHELALFGFSLIPKDTKLYLAFMIQTLL